MYDDNLHFGQGLYQAAISRFSINDKTVQEKYTARTRLCLYNYTTLHSLQVRMAPLYACAHTRLFGLCARVCLLWVCFYISVCVCVCVCVSACECVCLCQCQCGTKSSQHLLKVTQDCKQMTLQVYTLNIHMHTYIQSFNTYYKVRHTQMYVCIKLYMYLYV